MQIQDNMYQYEQVYVDSLDTFVGGKKWQFANLVIAGSLCIRPYLPSR